MKKFLEIPFFFLIIKLYHPLNRFKKDKVLVAEESKGWRTQPSGTDQD